MALVLDEPAEVEHQLLGPLDGEDRDDDVARRRAAVSRIDPGQQVVDPARVLVVPVAVGRFHDDVIGLLEERRVADDGPVPLADVAGEDDRPGVVRPLRR